MTERNVAALQAVIDRLGYGWPDERAKMAHDLDAAGVLAPVRADEDTLIDAMLEASRAYRADCKETGVQRNRRAELALMLSAVSGPPIG